FELGLNHDDRHLNAVAMQTRLPNIEGAGGIDMAELFRAGLRMNPSRVIVGEVRGHEAVPMLHAMSQGDDGSLSTIHARSSQGVFKKLMLFGASCAERLDEKAMALLIAEAVDLVVHMDSTIDGTRRVTSIREVCESHDAMVTSNELYRPDDHGQPQPHTPVSGRRATRLARHGYPTTRR
ncbi:MAG: ATPase, T2SS/T4P/T4SS family, partial [Stackebrandtia sp.]